MGAFPYPSDQGSQVLLEGTAKALADAGHDVRIVCYDHGSGVPDPGIPVHRAPSVPGYRRMRSGPDPVKPVLDLLLARTLQGVIRQHHADVVHAHNHEALGASILALGWTPEGDGRRGSNRGGDVRGADGLPKGRPALIYGEHTRFSEELPTYFRRGKRPFRLAGSLVDHTLPRMADAAVALSHRGAQGLRGIVRGPVAVIPPGVHRADFEGVVPCRAGPGRWLVYAGTPDKFQDVDRLPAVMRHLPGWRLLLVGSGWGEVPNARVVDAPWSEARGWIAGASVAALPRRVCAGFPMKLLNYAALGLRTVVAAGSARGVPGEECVLGDDPREFAAAVLRAADLPRVPASEVLDHWGWPRRAKALAELYREARR